MISSTSEPDEQYYTFVNPESYFSHQPTTPATTLTTPGTGHGKSLFSAAPSPISPVSSSSSALLDFQYFTPMREEEEDDDDDDDLNNIEGACGLATLTTAIAVHSNEIEEDLRFSTPSFSSYSLRDDVGRDSSSPYGSSPSASLLRSKTIWLGKSTTPITPTASYGKYLESVRYVQRSATTATPLSSPKKRLPATPTKTNRPLNHQEESSAMVSPSRLGGTSLARWNSLRSVQSQTTKDITRDECNTADSLLLSNYHKFPEITSTLSTSLTFVDSSSKSFSVKRPCSILKQYTNGDGVCGVVEIRNSSEEAVKFEHLVIFLEGVQYISVSDCEKVKRTVFLRLEEEEQKEEDHTEIEIEDNFKAIWGSTTKFNTKTKMVHSRPKNNIINPKTTYRFQFSFKLPKTATSTTYKTTVLPPTLSFYKQDPKYRHLPIDPDLKYGYIYDDTMVNGTPIVVHDLAQGDVSVQYSVLFGIVTKISPEHCSDLSGVQLAKLDCSKQSFIRFVPSIDGLLDGGDIDEGVKAWFDLKKQIEQKISGPVGGGGGVNDGVLLPSPVLSTHQLYTTSIKASMKKKKTKKNDDNPSLAALNRLKSKLLDLSHYGPDMKKSNIAPHGVITMSSPIPFEKIRYCTPSIFDKVNQWSHSESNNVEELNEVVINLRYVVAKPQSQSVSASCIQLPRVDSVEVDVHCIDYHSIDSVLSIPVTSEMLVTLMNENDQKNNRALEQVEDFTTGLRTQAQKLLERLSQTTKTDNESDELSQILQSLATIKSTTTKSQTYPALHKPIPIHSEWTTTTTSRSVNTNTIQYNSTLTIPLIHPVSYKIKEVMSPSFQTAYAGRCYVLKCRVGFKDEHDRKKRKKMVLDLPVSVALW